MTLQVVALSKSRHMIGESYTLNLPDIETYLQSWRDAQDDFILPDDLTAAVRVTGTWEGWTVVRVVCHPDAREPVSYFGVKVIDCDVDITNSPTRTQQNGRDGAVRPGTGTQPKWIGIRFSDAKPSNVDVRNGTGVTKGYIP